MPTSRAEAIAGMITDTDYRGRLAAILSGLGFSARSYQRTVGMHVAGIQLVCARLRAVAYCELHPTKLALIVDSIAALTRSR